MMPTFVEVAVNLPHILGVFHYHLPPELEGEVKRGHLVLVPFGVQTVQGVVVRFPDQPSVVETKAVIELVDPCVALTSEQIELAQVLARECLAPLAACIGLMLPPGVDQQADLLYIRQGQRPEGLSPVQTRLLNLLEQRGPLRGQQIEHTRCGG